MKSSKRIIARASIVSAVMQPCSRYSDVNYLQRSLKSNLIPSALEPFRAGVGIQKDPRTLVHD